MIRDEVRRFAALGRVPDEDDLGDDEAAERLVEAYHDAIEAVEAIKPLTDDEARELVGLFPREACFGLEFALMHAVESAPGWPLDDVLDGRTEWKRILRERADNSLEDAR